MSQRACILAIEISNPSLGGQSVCVGALCGKDGDGGGAVLLATETVQTGARGGHDDDLLPAIARACAAAGVRAGPGGNLARVAVSVGPGGYTSVRVACSAAQMIAEASGAKCVAIGTGLAALHQLRQIEMAKAGRVAPRIQSNAVALAGKGETAWVQIDDGRETSAGRVMNADDLAAMTDGAGKADVGVFLADQHVPLAMRQKAIALGWKVQAPTLSAETIMQLGAQASGAAMLDPSALVPVYPREPDAVTLWREKLARERLARAGKLGM